MRTRLVISLLVLFGLAAVAGCGDDEGGSGSTTTSPTETPDLAGTSWTLVSYTGVPVAVQAAAVAPLAFSSGGTVSGSTGCNQFSGTYTQDGGQLTIELGPMTQMACTEALPFAEEKHLIRLLPEVTGFVIIDGTLNLTGSDGAVLLTYTAGLASLEETSWTVTGVNTGTAVETTALTEKLTAEFGIEGAFSGFGGCNTMSGTYTVADANGLTFSPLSTTLIGCEPDIAALEAQYDAALGLVTTYEISGETLTLRDAEGATQLTLKLAT